MFDPSLPDPFKRVAAPAPAPTHSLQVNLTGMPVDELLELRRQIEELLPVKDIKDINLSRELVLQVQALQALQRRVLSDEDALPNQQAQCANSLSAALVNLVKVQTEVYTSERLKTIESILVESLDKLPAQAQEEFMQEYERALGMSNGD